MNSCLFNGGVNMNTNNQIKELQTRDVSELFASYRNGHYEPIGLFYHRDGEIFVGIDNTTGEAWTEEFEDLDSCLAWLERKGLDGEDCDEP